MSNFRALVEFRLNGAPIYKDEVFDGARLDHLSPSELDHLVKKDNGLGSPRIEETTDPIFRPDDPVTPPTPNTEQFVAVNTVYPTGRTIGGKAEFECLYEYTLVNHPSSTTPAAISVPAPADFTPMGVILSVDGGADNGTTFQGIEDSSSDIGADDMSFDRSTGSFTHTYAGNWNGYTMRLNVRYLEA